MKNVLYLFLTLFLYSCENSINQNHQLETALTMAGSNRGELEKVLKYYSANSKDSLKYKAACFLIENMPYQYYYEDEKIDSIFTYFKALYDNPSRNPQHILNEYKSKFGSIDLSGIRKNYDIQELDSSFLCSNIEHSFKVWEEQPWGKNVKFDDFCEYILPYKIKDEKPILWKQYYYEKYAPLLEICKEKNIDDPVKAAKILYGSLNRRNVRFTSIGPSSIPHVGPYIAELMSGSCRELTDYMVYVCRSVGIPCAIDYIPLWGDKNVGHSWLSYIDKKGNVYMQDFPQSIRDNPRGDNRPKVYRQTYSVNRKMERAMSQSGSSIHPEFENPQFVDVTLHYSACYLETLKIPKEVLFKNKSKAKIVYLCSPRGIDWYPIDWSVFDKNNLQFEDIQKGSVHVLATYEGGELVYQSYPFIIKCPTGELEVLGSDNYLTDVKLLTKYSLEDDRTFIDRMLDGVFEASNFADFRQKDTLYHIKEKPYRLLTKVSSISNKQYRYVRYYGPQNGNCNIAEVAFFENEGDTIPLSGVIIGTPGSWSGTESHEYTNVFDGLTTTSFDYKESYGGWAGIDLGEPKSINMIIYTPRNRDNYIRRGDTYELFYHRKGWETLGKKVSTSDSLIYKDVPRDAFLYLKNHTRGVQERIFTYEEGVQIWR